MHDTAMPGNRHPVDRLADVRAKIKALQDEEADLKAQISAEMGAIDSLGGDEWIAFQKLQERKGALDEATIAQHLGVKSLEPYRKPATTFVVIRLEPRAREVA